MVSESLSVKGLMIKIITTYMKLIFNDYFQLKTQKTFDHIERAFNAKMKIGFLIISALQVQNNKTNKSLLIVKT